MTFFVSALQRGLLQVTVLALVTMLLYLLLAGRKKPLGSSLAVLCLIGSAMLFGLAFVPLPSWWDVVEEQTVFDADPPMSVPLHGESRSVSSTEETPSVSQAGRHGVTLRWLLGALPSTVEQMQRQVETTASLWPRVLAVGVLLGIGVCWLRLLMGLFAVWSCCRSSIVVQDPSMLELLAQLQSDMRIDTQVSLRESAHLTTAAVVGWWNPVLLLPPDWNTWNERERRAVFAHELAHVARRDYLALVVARCCSVVLFYHPVIWWIVRRLQLEQEWAADSLAAEQAGGHRRYLASLARLALRQEERLSVYESARRFLPAPGTLKRRIGMLKNPTTSWLRGRLGRWLAGLSLALCAVVASGLRLGAQEPTSTSVPDAKSQPSLKPFDMRYVPDDCAGVFAIRPSEFFRHSGKKRFTDETHQAMHAALTEGFSIQQSLGFSLDEVEQITGGIRISHDAKRPEGQKNVLIADLSSVRLVRSHDWKKHIHKALPHLKTAKTKSGKEYYKCEGKLFGFGTFSPEHPFCFYVADDRTLVLGIEKQRIEKIDAGIPKAPNWLQGWPTVERCFFALGLRCSDESMKNSLPISSPEEKEFAKLLDQSSCVVVGVDWTKTLSLNGSIYAKNNRSAKKLKKSLSVLLKQIDEMLEDEPEEEAIQQVINDLYRVELGVETNRVTLTSGSKIDLASELERQFAKVKAE